MSDQNPPENLFKPLINRRWPSNTLFAELFLAPGPVAIGVTGQNRLQDFVGQEWMLLLDGETREVQLWRENGSWQQVMVPGHPLIGGIAPAGARRFTLCFDQAATPVVAYELDGVIRVTRWDPVVQAYIQNVSFAGVDPALQFDAVWTGGIPGSDVLLFYLTPDRSGVRARVQRELYAVENAVWDYGMPVILDRVIPAPIRYQVLVSGADGRALPLALVSDPYPYAAEDSLAVAGVGPTAGSYISVTISYDVEPDALSAGAVGPTSGEYAEYVPPIIERDVSPELLTVAGLAPSGGAYLSVTIMHAVEADELDVLAASPTGGEYSQVVNYHSVESEELEAAAIGPSGGSYDAA